MQHVLHLCVLSTQFHIYSRVLVFLLVFPLIFYLLVFAFCGLGETTEVTMNVVDEDGAEQP